ncbi:Isopenicillin N synthase [Corchorus olitorius]|uniref:Isopenicillin N synthase n=1 Tax=Corchorus olitorius TaxID=93759 RepID=A0A1R3K3A8_9ROSI|nr:Isopenicillin N synthase [Corchorus olitorius]
MLPLPPTYRPQSTLFIKDFPGSFKFNQSELALDKVNHCDLGVISHRQKPNSFTLFSIDQTLTNKATTMGEVDPAFIQELEHRPKLSTSEAEGIPLIDLSVLNSADAEPDLQSLVSEIGNACREWGFFQIVNHGVSVEQRQKLENACREFFAQPLEEKVKVRRDEVKIYGYYDREHTKNVRDWKEVFDFSLQNPTIVPASTDPDDKEVVEWHNQWPDNPPELREVCEEFAEELQKLGYKLMELIALSLGLPPNRFLGFFKDQTSYIRLNHYPPCPAPDLALGLGRHNDSGALTILYQDDVGGLEVKRRSDGEWIRVKPTPDALIVNVGDIIQVWSNETYKSMEHRVAVNSERERFSIPFFFYPAHYTMVQPLEELTSEKNPPKYRPYNWGKFLINKKVSNLKKLDVENIQIHQFKIQHTA